MIQIQKLEKKFGEKTLFSNFTLEIPDDEFVIFSGASGCGKTTLLNMIGGIEPFDQGEIIVNNIPLSNQKNLLNYFRYEIGFLFQNFALIENKTVQENLRIIKKKCRTDITMEEALQRVGLTDKMDKKVYTLSGGEQQRIALARLMMKKCNIILADEPTGSLDRKNAEVVIDILHQLHLQGKTIVLVTHDDLIKRKGTRLIEI